MRAPISLLLLALAPLALSGCELFMNPSAMPSGYTYHQDVYKAAPGPNSKELGYDYSLAKNDEILLVWRESIGDLVNQFEEEIGSTAQAIYIEPLPSDSAFNNTYDDVLREELSARGYTLAPVAGTAPHLRYEAFLPDEKNALAPGADKSARDFVLVLTLLDPTVLGLVNQKKEKEEAAVLGWASGIYRLPAYGHESAVPVFSLFEPVTGGAP